MDPLEGRDSLPPAAVVKTCSFLLRHGGDDLIPKNRGQEKGTERTPKSLSTESTLIYTNKQAESDVSQQMAQTKQSNMKKLSLTKEKSH